MADAGIHRHLRDAEAVAAGAGQLPPALVELPIMDAIRLTFFTPPVTVDPAVLFSLGD